MAISRKAAVDAKCKDCIYDDQDVGTWRQQVGACVAVECPLHPIRPMPRVGVDGENPVVSTTSGQNEG